MHTALLYRNWPLRSKFALLLIVASILPSAVAAYISLREMRLGRMQDTQRMLVARAEQLSHELDSTHTGYLRSLQRVALQPAVTAYCASEGKDHRAAQERMEGIFKTFPKSDALIRGMALINRAGVVEISTDPDALGANLSRRATVARALRGTTLISDVYVSTAQGRMLPTVAYLVPVPGLDGQTACVISLWVHADAVWNVLKAAYQKAGPNSFAVLYDNHGIRIGHSFRQELVFRPGGQLPPDVMNEFVTTGRFGASTGEYLRDVRPFPNQFDRSRGAAGSTEVFRGYASANATWNYGVGSRLQTVPWTVFYMMPEASLKAEIAEATRSHAILFTLIGLFAVGVGVAFAAPILRPVMALRQATRRVASGDYGIRVPVAGRDELGHLAENFNEMAQALQVQAAHLKESHDQLRAHADDLEVANKDLEAFAFSVSHDLRSPLAVVNGFTSLLAASNAKSGDKDAQHYLARIRASTSHMDELIQGLLRLSKLGRQALAKQEVDVGGLVEEVIAELRHHGGLERHAISIAGDLGTVLADKVLLRQVFANLLSNAAKFSAKVSHPEIVVDSTFIEGQRAFSIRDNGPGFDPAFADQLFQPFTRLHSQEEFAGVGLGLSIVQRIVHKHGGNVWAHAKEGNGAVFSFTLPGDAGG